jgi:hypothetical protein
MPSARWVVLACSLALPAIAGAQGQAPAASAAPPASGGQGRDDRAGLARQEQNPASGLMRFELLANVDLGLGPSDESALRLLFRPFLRIELTPRWTLVSWTILPFLSRPPAGAGEERANGLGDTRQHFFLTPSRRGALLWAIGPVALVPTATKTALGAGHFGLGPTGTLAYTGEPFTAGVLAHHFESITGAEGRERVSETSIRLYATFTLPTSITFTLDSDQVVEWQRAPGDRYLGQIGATVERVIKIGDQLVNLMFGGRYYIARPDGGPEWNLRMSTTLLLPAEPAEPPGSS